MNALHPLAGLHARSYARTAQLELYLILLVHVSVLDGSEHAVSITEVTTLDVDTPLQ